MVFLGRRSHAQVLFGFHCQYTRYALAVSSIGYAKSAERPRSGD